MTTVPPGEPRAVRSRLLSDARVRFLVVGSLAAAGEFGIFVALLSSGMAPVWANAVSFVCGLVGSFIGYRLWSFAGEHTMGATSQFASYLLLAIINVTLTSLIVTSLVNWSVQPWVAKLVCMVLVAAWNYLLLNRIVFKRG